ncbi:hypothetical protein KQX54_000906, partial [Cotesia glomerata]
EPTQVGDRDDLLGREVALHQLWEELEERLRILQRETHRNIRFFDNNIHEREINPRRH